MEFKLPGFKNKKTLLTHQFRLKKKYCTTGENESYL